MAYEAMNCAGYLKQRMIVILNDNGQVYHPQRSFVYYSCKRKPANFSIHIRPPSMIHL
jgi:deoxyxylulose-5-phosphate synthase